MSKEDALISRLAATHKNIQQYYRISGLSFGFHSDNSQYRERFRNVKNFLRGGLVPVFPAGRTLLYEIEVYYQPMGGELYQILPGKPLKAVRRMLPIGWDGVFESTKNIKY